MSSAKLTAVAGASAPFSFRYWWRSPPRKNSVTSIKGLVSVTAPRNCTIFGCLSFISKLTSCLKSCITSLSSDRDGRMRLTAIGVPRQLAFRISPKEPFPMITAFEKSNSRGLISQSALFVRGGGIVFGSKWLPVFPYRRNKIRGIQCIWAQYHTA